MNKIISNFYLIRVGGKPSYVGYTNRSIETRFKEHLKDKDFGEGLVELENLGSLEYSFTWDEKLINTYSREVSNKETNLIIQYGTQDSVWQKGFSGNLGGQTWNNIKYFIRTNRDNPKFRGLPEEAILSYLDTSDNVFRYLKSFINRMDDPVTLYMKDFVNHMDDPISAYMKNFVKNMDDPVSLYMKDFIKDMNDSVWLYMKDFVKNMDDPVSIYMKNFVTSMDDPVSTYMKGFVHHMDDHVSVYMKNFVNHMNDPVAIYMGSFASNMSKHATNLDHH